MQKNIESHQQNVKVDYFPECTKVKESVICPWCFNLTQIDNPESAVCKICQREIREEDLIND